MGSIDVFETHASFGIGQCLPIISKVDFLGVIVYRANIPYEGMFFFLMINASCALDGLDCLKMTLALRYSNHSLVMFCFCHSMDVVIALHPRRR